MTDDDRVTCIACRNNRGGWCQKPREAGIAISRRPFELGPDLAEQPQRCPAHEAKPEPRSPKC